MDGPDYVFDRATTDEEARLEHQSRIIDPITEHHLHATGFPFEGQRVLELGSGAGDVTLLLASEVGKHGSVTAVEGSPTAIEASTRRVTEAGFANVTFLEGDLTALDEVLEDEPPFDALVGRFVLQFVPDAVRTLKTASRHVRAGGPVWFQECDTHYVWSYPATPLWDEARDRFHRGMTAAGVEQRMGLRLYGTFLDAGLPAPELRLEAAIAGGGLAHADVWAGVIEAIVPTLEHHGIATAEEVDAPTLATRLLEEAVTHRAVVVNIVVVGAWSLTFGG
jgi:ubiquinone/menaquinone biosynthesis C-methylase UbiE